MNNIFEELKIGYRSTWTREFILTYKELLVLIEYIQEHRNAIILGGDVLHENDQYTGMNWYYDPMDTLSQIQNSINSCDNTKHYIFCQLPHAEAYHYIVVLDESMSVR